MHPLALWGAQTSPLMRQTHPPPSGAPTIVAVSLLLSDPAGCAPPQLPATPERTRAPVPAVRAVGQTHLCRRRVSSALRNNPGSLSPMTVVSFQVMAGGSRWLSSAGGVSASRSRRAAGISVSSGKDAAGPRRGQPGPRHARPTGAHLSPSGGL